MNILINGLYRSGNNWSKYLMNENIIGCNVSHNHFPLAHHPYFNWHDFHIMIFKNPYNWVTSIMKQSWDMPFYYDLEPTVGCEEVVINIGYPNGNTKDIPIRKQYTISLQKLINCYNNYFYYWSNHLQGMSGKYIFVQYEQILANPEKFIDCICEKTGLKRKEVFTDSGTVENSRDWAADRKQIYLSRPKMDKSILGVVSHALDDDIMTTLGFQYLD
jgi:hypothetical protein